MATFEIIAARRAMATEKIKRCADIIARVAQITIEPMGTGRHIDKNHENVAMLEYAANALEAGCTRIEESGKVQEAQRKAAKAGKVASAK